jgi:prepilin-type N-terminal cleavage/methylation domain-containing protein
MENNKSHKGFTLIEILVVIAIIGLLTSIIIVNIRQATTKARDAKRISEIRQIRLAIELYYDAMGYYPQFTGNARCNVGNNNSLAGLITEKLLASVPLDPVNSSATPHRLCYEYMGIGTAENYDFTSGWYCSGRSRTDYEWSFLFSTETTELNFPRLTNSAGTPNNEYTYCIHGLLRY